MEGDAIAPWRKLAGTADQVPSWSVLQHGEIFVNQSISSTLSLPASHDNPGELVLVRSKHLHKPPESLLVLLVGFKEVLTNRYCERSLDAHDVSSSRCPIFKVVASNVSTGSSTA